jgi:hydroxypyruvate isomerase
VSDYGFTLAVCAEMVFTDLPFLERVEIIRDLGFAVELWDWTQKDLDALAATEARVTSMTGYVEGDLIDPAGADALVRTARQSIEASRTLGAPNLNLHGTGLDARGLPVKPIAIVTGEMWLAAEKTLARIAALGRERGRGVLSGEPEPADRPPGHAVRPRGRDAHPRRFGRQPAPADEPGSVPRPDRRR